MADLYEDFQDDATELLTEFNQGTITLTKVVPGSVDVNNREVPVAPTKTTYALKAVAKPVSARFVNGTTILATDKEITCAAFASIVAPGDVCTVDGDAHKVKAPVKRIPAAGTVVVWKFLVES